MNLPNKEQWLSFDKAQKQKAIADALFLLDFIYTKGKKLYRHTKAEGEIPRNKQLLKDFLRNTREWEQELEQLSKNDDTTASSDM